MTSVFRMFIETFCPGNGVGPSAGHDPSWDRDADGNPLCAFCRQRIWRNSAMPKWRAFRYIIFEEEDPLD